MKHYVTFQNMVENAMRMSGHSVMRPVIEKELLHYDILFALDLRKNVFARNATVYFYRCVKHNTRIRKIFTFYAPRNFSVVENY